MYESYANTAYETSPVVMLMMSILPLLIMLAVGVFFCVVWGKLFKKAGLPWERIFVPFYGSYWKYKFARCQWMYWVAIAMTIGFYAFYCVVAMQSIDANEMATSGYSLFPLFFMIVMFVLNCIYCCRLAKAFGKGVGFALGLIFLNVIFLPILAFGSAEYQYLPTKSEQ